jgi:transcriptional regulator with XRE-family HTH domain
MQMTLRERIDILRKRKKLSYQKIAEILGAPSKWYMMKYIDGTQRIPDDALARLEDALGAKLNAWKYVRNSPRKNRRRKRQVRKPENE